MRVYLTGATSFVMGAVARRLVARGDEVVALVLVGRRHVLGYRREGTSRAWNAPVWPLAQCLRETFGARAD